MRFCEAYFVFMFCITNANISWKSSVCVPFYCKIIIVNALNLLLAFFSADNNEIGTGRYYTDVEASDVTSDASGYTKTVTAKANKPTPSEIEIKCETSTKLKKIIPMGIYHDCREKKYDMEADLSSC